MCILFPSSIGDLGLTWFEKFPKGSIASWAQLVEAFVINFKTNTKMPIEMDQLLIIDMSEKETLKSYNNRYWEIFNQIECTNTSREKKDGARTKAKSDTIAMLDKRPSAKANTVDKKDRSRKNNRSKDPKARRLRVYTAITTVFKKPIYLILSEICDEPFVQQPAKLGEAHRRDMTNGIGAHSMMK
ncbi:uncharacterized protein LOC114268557 [Camellia sinensis]|uniref:uncharacterized protein LOC114268557 n=1 Tax=Camellia sinensis TaxID=4442 RepID=UPI001036A0DF|nr:uncharacterized protein LOC114268557 [Camellia sinensis]